MTVRITKTVRIAEKTPAMPQVYVVEGEVRDDLSDHVSSELIRLEWAVEVADGEKSEVVNADKEPDKEEGVVNTEAPDTLKSELEAIALEKMDGPMGSEKKAKKALEDIGKERYGFDVDKRMGVDKIIASIVDEAFKAE